MFDSINQVFKNSGRPKLLVAILVFERAPAIPLTCSLKPFTAVISQEDEWFVAQCLEVDVASQGESHDTALENLKEASEIAFRLATSDRTSECPKNRDGGLGRLGR